jgi:arylsulfatase A-like enzyme
MGSRLTSLSVSPIITVDCRNILIERWLIACVRGSHGYFQGESGEWEKKMLFENTARVPLIIHTPDHPRQMRTTELAELVDLYPTVAALAGLPAPLNVRTNLLNCPHANQMSMSRRCC